MINRTIEELSQTEGGKTAIKIKKQNDIVKIVGLIFIAICAVLLFSAIESHNVIQYCFGFVILIFVGLSVRVYYGRIHNFLNIKCDPYIAEEIYSYMYVRYIDGKKSRNESAKLSYLLFIARSIIFQGDYDRAFAILSQMDVDKLNKCNKILACSYHDLMRMYYFEKKDIGVLLDMKKYLFQFSKSPGLKKRYRQMMENEIELINLFLSLEKEDYSLYNTLSQKESWKSGAKIKRVSYYWFDAKVHKKQGNIEAAKADCQYVIENGNRLYYVDLAKKMLEEIEQEIQTQ